MPAIGQAELQDDPVWSEPGPGPDKIQCVQWGHRVVLHCGPQLLHILDSSGDICVETNTDIKYDSMLPTETLLWVVLQDGSIAAINNTGSILHVQLKSKGCLIQAATLHAEPSSEELSILSDSKAWWCCTNAALMVCNAFNDHLKEIELPVEAGTRITRKSSPEWAGLTVKRETANLLLYNCSHTGLAAVQTVTGERVLAVHAAPKEPLFALQLEPDVLLVATLHSAESLYQVETDEFAGWCSNELYYVRRGQDLIEVRRVKQAAKHRKDTAEKDQPVEEEISPFRRLEVLVQRAQNGESVEVILPLLLPLFTQEVTELLRLVDAGRLLSWFNPQYIPLLEALDQRMPPDGDLRDTLEDTLIRLEVIEVAMRAGWDFVKEALKEASSGVVAACCALAHVNRLDLAELAWHKYARSGAAAKLTASEMITLLHAADDCRVTEAMQWARELLKPVVRAQPFLAAEAAASWVVERLHALELGRGNWEETAIKLIDEVLTALNQADVRATAADKLERLRVHAGTLRELRVQYRVQLRLDELSALAPLDLLLTVLHRAYTEDIDRLCIESGWVSIEASRQGLQLDEVLRASTERAAGHDARLYALLTAMRSHARRRSALLHVLRALSPPWGPNLLGLAQKEAVHDTADAISLKHLVQYAAAHAELEKLHLPSLKPRPAALRVGAPANWVGATARRLNSLQRVNNALGSSNSSHSALTHLQNLALRDKKSLAHALLAKHTINPGSSLLPSCLALLRTTKPRLLDDALLESAQRTHLLARSYQLNISMNELHEAKVRRSLENGLEKQPELRANALRRLLHAPRSEPTNTSPNPANLRNEHAFSLLKQKQHYVKNQSIAWEFHYMSIPSSSSVAIAAKCCEQVKHADISEFKSLPESMEPVAMMRVLGDQARRRAHAGLPPIDQSRAVKCALRMTSRVLLSADSDDLLVQCALGIPGSKIAANYLQELRCTHITSVPPALERYLLTASHTYNTGILGDFELNSGRIRENPAELAELTVLEGNEQPTDSRSTLLAALVQRPNTLVNRLAVLARSLQVPADDALALHVLASVTSQQYDSGLSTRAALLVEDIRSESVRRRLAEWLRELWRHGELLLHGHTLALCPYRQEAYLCIHTLLRRLVPDWRAVRERLLLHYLQCYRRAQPPRRPEMDAYSRPGGFPEQGRKRLPFPPLAGGGTIAWAELKHEVTLDTYRRWLPAAALLALDQDTTVSRDMLCSNALKQSMTKLQREHAEHDGWELHPRDEELLRSAHECARHITNTEWAGACLYYVLQGARRGADQLAAAQLCHDYALAWAESECLPATEPAVLRNMRGKQRALSTLHALHRLGRAQQEYMQLCAQPARLMRHLLMDQKLPRDALLFDVHALIDHIAECNTINVAAARFQLLEHMLERGGAGGAALGSEELARARCVLAAAGPRTSAVYLARAALDEAGAPARRLRATQCLLSAADEDTLQCVGCTRPALLESLDALHAAARLHAAHLPHLAPAFLPTGDPQERVHVLVEAWSAAAQRESGSNAEGLRALAQAALHWGDAVCLLDGGIAALKALCSALARAGLTTELAALLERSACAGRAADDSAWRAALEEAASRGAWGRCARLVVAWRGNQETGVNTAWKAGGTKQGAVLLSLVGMDCAKNLLNREGTRALVAGVKAARADCCLAPSALAYLQRLAA